MVTPTRRSALIRRNGKRANNPGSKDANPLAELPSRIPMRVPAPTQMWRSIRPIERSANSLPTAADELPCLCPTHIVLSLFCPSIPLATSAPEFMRGYYSCSTLQVSRARASHGRVLALEKAWNHALEEKDTKALDMLLASSMISVDIDGSVQNKANFLLASNRLITSLPRRSPNRTAYKFMEMLPWSLASFASRAWKKESPTCTASGLSILGFGPTAPGNAWPQPAISLQRSNHRSNPGKRADSGGLPG